jgi:CHRD domain
MSHRILLAAVLVMATFGARADEQPIQLKADLDGSHEVPATQTSGKGKLEGALNRTTKELNYTVTYQGLTGPATAAHFHGPADPTKNAGVVVPLKAPLDSPVKGSATLDDKQIGELMANNWYVNIHTAKNPTGEIRGQVVHAGP